ncbi:MAG: glutamine amidotransferase [Cellvibrionaceae bacterium]|jgi:glutamine amidotransferase
MSASSVAIIDYGMGNLHSVSSALAYVSPDSHIEVTADKNHIINADKVIFPGVGAIRDCMQEIHRLGFDTLVPEIIASGKPVLGICVGMQVLLESSEENNGVDGIGVLPGHVRFFGEAALKDALVDSDGAKLKVPHMGWNNVEQLIAHPLWHNIDNHARFYFLHSYYVEAEESAQVMGRCTYGKAFAAAMGHNNLFATQFHPEKSHTAGLQLLKNFVNWNGEP